jgi:hypothetical protein
MKIVRKCVPEFHLLDKNPAMLLLVFKGPSPLTSRPANIGIKAFCRMMKERQDTVFSLWAYFISTIALANACNSRDAGTQDARFTSTSVL